MGRMLTCEKCGKEFIEMPNPCLGTMPFVPDPILCPRCSFIRFRDREFSWANRMLAAVLWKTVNTVGYKLLRRMGWVVVFTTDNLGQNGYYGIGRWEVWGVSEEDVARAQHAAIS